MEECYEIQNEQLISLVRERPVLWNRNIEIYKDRVKTKEAWYDICTVLDSDFENRNDAERKEFWQFVMKKWTNLRDSWTKYAKSTNPKKRKYIYYNHMKFLSAVLNYGSHGRPRCMKKGRKVDSEDSSSSMKQEQDAEDFVEFEACLDENSPTQVEIVAEPALTRSATHRLRRKRKLDESDSFLEETLPPMEDNARLMFLKSLYPSVESFTNAQFLDFQIGLLQLIKDISTET